MTNMMEQMSPSGERRIMALWFPRLGAERYLRRARGTVTAPVALVRESGNLRVLSCVSEEAAAAGLSVGQPLRDAVAVCPELITQVENRAAEAAFLGHLRRWAGKFSPWVSEADEAGLFIDLTGASHLFGGEAGTAELVEADCRRFGLSVTLGIADTPGAAWALARFSGQRPSAARSGDAIDQEAYATRARAVKRRNWERGGPAPQLAQKVVPLRARQARIAEPGQTRRAVGPLPIAALRLPEETVTELNRVGLRRIEDLLGQPRAPLLRRYGQILGQRLDQLLGLLAEPISPARAPALFACRISLPEPIGLESDVAAAIERMLPTLARRLAEAGRGARMLRLEAYRADGTSQAIDVGLARPSSQEDRMRPLLAMKIGEIDAGFGIDMLRLIATQHEEVRPEQHRRLPSNTPQATPASPESDIDDLMGRLGARIGLEGVTRRAPGSSHIPEKSAQTLAAAFSAPAHDWPRGHPPRPLTLFPVEIVDAPEAPNVPPRFKWRGRWFDTKAAQGPERIAPEWWLEERPWRTGTRDYWRISTHQGERLWLYYAHGAEQTGGWFCHGQFA
ncbi:MAG: DNA polymerase Y family protein [Pseudomonadota bacterium]